MRRTFNETTDPLLTEHMLSLLESLETHPPSRPAVQLPPQLSLQTILTDSLINPNGTPFVDVNSKRVITTTGDNSAIARDMHRRIVNMVSSGNSVSREEEDNSHHHKSKPSIYCTDVDNYPPITPLALDQSEMVEQLDVSEINHPKESCESPIISTRKVRLRPSPSAPDLHDYIAKASNSPPKSRPHTAHANISRPLFPSESSNQLNHSGIAFPAAVDDSDKSLKLQQLQAQQKQWAVRLGQTANRDYGLPADLFEMDLCVATSKVSPETGIRFLKSMAAKPSIYEGLRPRRRPQSAGNHHS